ncbi:MAG: MarR family transcriptional regulator [Curvibacter sp.]|nr:MarR family transcriptional regulator [Curvibacter sp.]
MTLPRLSQPQAIDDLLLYRLSRLLAVGGASVIRLCEGRFGITRREWRILSLLAGQEGLLSSQLAERAQLDRARTSRAIGSLVEKQLLQRTPRAGDRRLADLRLTPAGRALHDALFPLVVGINQQLLAALGADEVADLDARLDRLQAHAEALSLQQTDLPRTDRHKGRRGR